MLLLALSVFRAVLGGQGRQGRRGLGLGRRPLGEPHLSGVLSCHLGERQTWAIDPGRDLGERHVWGNTHAQRPRANAHVWANAHVTPLGERPSIAVMNGAVG